MFVTLGLIASLGLGVPARPMDHLRLYNDLGSSGGRISIWLDRSSPYDRGDRARVYVSADRDSYLTVLRIDTDGRVRVLFPQDPWDDNYITGGRTFEVEDRGGDHAFRVDDAPGAGYVFAIVSDQKFDYSSILTQRDNWDYRTIADGQVRGDPYVAVTDLAERIVPTGDFDYDLAQYDVLQHYDYPRFVCYDCHAYAPYYTWNPYAHSCVRFRVVIYDDPYYYPYRYYGGRRVVTVRPRRPQPRYVFVDNNGGNNNYVTRIPNRPRREDEGGGSVGGGTGGDQMRPRRAEDVGGRGSIPVPGDTRRRIITQPDQRQGDPAEQQPERRRIERQGEKPESRQPESRRPETQPNPPGLEPQPRAPQDEPRRMEPQRPPEARPEPQRRPETRPEPQRPPEPRAEPRPEPRAEPKHEEPRRQEPQPRAEPRRQPSGGGGRSGSPELRRRHG
jgi:hypothetical protein